MRFTLASTLLLLSVVSASNVKRAIVPSGWTLEGAAPVDHILDVRLALKHGDFEQLEKLLYEVSDPDNTTPHLQSHDVDALLAPHPETHSKVASWLTSHGIQEEHIEYSPAKDWVTITVPVGLANRLLNTEYSVYRHTSGVAKIRTPSYTLPEHIEDHIDTVVPSTFIGGIRAQKSTVAEVGIAGSPVGLRLTTPATSPSQNCSEAISIDCLRKLYKTDGYTAKQKNNKLAVTSYLEEVLNFNDLKVFLTQERPEAANVKPKVILYNGANNNQSRFGQGEGALDIQFATGIAYPTPTEMYITGGRPAIIPDAVVEAAGKANPDPVYGIDSNEPYLPFIFDFKTLSNNDLPKTLSTSYGDDEQTVPKDYALRVCSEFAALGARGVSILFSSGDAGVGGYGDTEADQKATCVTNDGTNKPTFLPAFPASCPYVTTVGGTGGYPVEHAVTQFGSGGGFSNYFAQPSYQKSAVATYFKTVDTSAYNGLFNKNGRGYPDVAAQGENFDLGYGGRYFRSAIGGTSASSPTFAAVVSQLNDYRLSKKLKPLGFLNPFIYNGGCKGLNDITVGSSFGCGTNGFPAAAGWDPVTGFGTPNFQKLQKLVCSGK